MSFFDTGSKTGMMEFFVSSKERLSFRCKHFQGVSQSRFRCIADLPDDGSEVG